MDWSDSLRRSRRKGHSGGASRADIIEGLDANGRNWLGRRLAPVEDAGVAIDTEADVPAAVSWVSKPDSNFSMIHPS